MTHSAGGLGHTADSTSRIFSALRSCWGAFQEWRQRGRSQDELCSLSDRALMDIGMTRGEIEYVVSSRSFDGEERAPPLRCDRHVPKVPQSKVGTLTQSPRRRA
ncbi:MULTISPECIES: DUF1127 domain-containing protein [unclassified Bradyrhizobium]|nr:MULTISPECIES: DUF1127 domain-containing protein [unclassified Bradyrhizobium]MBR1223883.1 DUF1127 domain-containing protein [Bradyrhizobium sp. AUGA SZCCT0176]MBR1233591.1 DUF1127 domain-containing protein [Bradyrhizobium sp. AUGA SZCCT0182]MBR1283420.1 DUF1127 domain-containing protein [Bradyrhizobium sp. AUGA SZCCT0177]MBR1298311.1 DUF1127 domain-containing protein [Bradyrhizobium sp. AUGA SZCCT0042]